MTSPIPDPSITHGAPHNATTYFGCRFGWGAFRVVSWHGVEEISEPFRYELLLQWSRAQGDVALDELLGTGATLRLRTELGCRTVHGVVSRAEQVEQTETRSLVCVELVAHFERARLRRACQVFRKQSIVAIVSAALRNDTPARPRSPGGLEELPAGSPVPLDRDPSYDSFEEPRAWFRWDIRDSGALARLKSETYREHVTQYDESDFDFVTRLLAEEGLSYYVEHGGRDSVLTITDAAGEATLVQTPLHARLQGDHNLFGGVGGSGRDFPQEVILSYRTSEALRSRAVRLRGYRPDTPRVLAEAFESSGPADPAAEGESGHYEYPAGQGDPALAPWQHRAHSLAQRFESEAHLRSGSGTVRSLHAGVRLFIYGPHDWPFNAGQGLVDLEGASPPQGGVADEVVVVAVETRGHEAGFDMRGGEQADAEPAFHASFVALPKALTYRPAWPGPKPRIHGLQEALVTAEEQDASCEINTNAEGDVRVRFPWDQRPMVAGVPSSRWVRVSQPWSGTSYGAVWTPRVGQLVVCAFRDGDPDDPVVVGRAYSKQMPAPDPIDQPATVSRFKSRSSPFAAGYGDKYNEMLFEDAAGNERLELTACRDMLVQVGRDIAVLVKRDGSVTVERNVHRKVGGSEWTEVSGDCRLEVGGTLSVSAGKIEVKSAKGIVVDDHGGVTVSTPDLTVTAGSIELATGKGASIRLSGGNIDIKASGVVTVNGSIITLN